MKQFRAQMGIKLDAELADFILNRLTFKLQLRLYNLSRLLLEMVTLIT